MELKDNAKTGGPNYQNPVVQGCFQSLLSFTVSSLTNVMITREMYINNDFYLFGDKDWFSACPHR